MFTFWRYLFGSADPVAQPARSKRDDERRAWPRYKTEMQAKVQLTGAERIRAQVRDLSRGGANLVVEACFDVGHILSLELHTKAGEPRSILASVVRVMPGDDGTWALGCIFSLELSDDDLGVVSARKVASAGKDRRIWVRSSCEARAAFRKFGEPASAAVPVDVLNISASGIGLLMDFCPERGVMLHLDLFDRSKRKVCGMVARVVRATAYTGKAFAVGCSFIRELTEEELEALL